MNLHHTLVHAATAYDRRQSKSKRYNPYALAQYLARIDEVEQDVAAGAEPRAALCAAFTGSLLSTMLRAIEAPAATPAELMGAGWSYQPIFHRP
jgi:hypothetical protein